MHSLYPGVVRPRVYRCVEENTFFPSTPLQCCPHCCLFVFSSETSPLNEVVSEAFVRFFVEIVGHYSLFLTPAEREERTLQREAFRKAVSSKSLRRFLEVFMETQMFGGFIQERELRKQGVRGEGLCGAGSPAVAPRRGEMPPAPSPAAWPPAGGSVPVQRRCKGGGREAPVQADGLNLLTALCSLQEVA